MKALVAQNLSVAILMDLVVKNDPSLVAVSLTEPGIFEIGIVEKKHMNFVISKASFDIHVVSCFFLNI